MKSGDLVMIIKTTIKHSGTEYDMSERFWTETNSNAGFKDYWIPHGEMLLVAESPFTWSYSIDAKDIRLFHPIYGVIRGNAGSTKTVNHESK